MFNEVYTLNLGFLIYVAMNYWVIGGVVNNQRCQILLRSEWFPIIQKTPEKLKFLSSILDLSF